MDHWLQRIVDIVSKFELSRDRRDKKRWTEREEFVWELDIRKQVAS